MAFPSGNCEVSCHVRDLDLATPSPTRCCDKSEKFRFGQHMYVASTSRSHSRK